MSDCQALQYYCLSSATSESNTMHFKQPYFDNTINTLMTGLVLSYSLQLPIMLPLFTFTLSHPNSSSSTNVIYYMQFIANTLFQRHRKVTTYFQSLRHYHIIGLFKRHEETKHFRSPLLL